MALQLGAAREALISGGAPAGEAATYETRLATTDARLTLLTWMVGANIALTAAVLARLM